MDIRGTNSLGQLAVEGGCATFIVFYFLFLVDSSLSNSVFESFIGHLLETIEMPNNGGRVNAYFYDIFTDIWISQEMVFDVARLIKENPSYKICVMIYFHCYSFTVCF